MENVKIANVWTEPYGDANITNKGRSRAVASMDQRDQIWRKFCQLAKNLKSVHFIMVYLIFGKILYPLWQHCYGIKKQKIDNDAGGVTFKKQGQPKCRNQKAKTYFSSVN